MQSLLLITNLRRFTPYFHNTCTEISAMALRKDKQDLVAEFLVLSRSMTEKAEELNCATASGYVVEFVEEY